MSILSRPKLAPQQRFDLEDWNALIGALCGDAKLFTQKFWSANPLILNGFVTSGIGNTTATVTVAGGALVAAGGAGDQSWFVAPSTEPAKTVTLQAGTKNYLEISLAYTGANELLRAFWDAVANGGTGAEFNQLTETIENLEMSISVSTVGFSGDNDKIPLAIVETNGGGVIKTILDQRRLFWRLGKPQDESYEFPWSSREEASLSLTLTGISGSFTVGETVTFDGAETATVVDFTGSVLKVKDLSAATFSNGDTILGVSSAASGTLDTAEEAFTGADKDLKTTEDAVKALMTEVKLMKGTSRWFELASNSMTGVTNFLNSIITQYVAGAEYSWDGTEFGITDASGSPADADALAGLRILGNSQNLLLTRQDGQGGSTTITIADGEVLFVKLPASGDRTYSGEGSGNTNFQVVAKASFDPVDENFWIAYREGDRLYVRGYGELQPGESAPISDPAKAELEAQINANQAKSNQDRNIKVIEGGTWSLNNAGDTLTLSADAYVEIGGLEKIRNTISAQNISLPNANSVAYVEINRDGTGAAVLTVNVADVDALSLTDNTVIIARKVTDGVLVGMNCFLLQPNEYLTLDGALAEINKLLGQLKLKPHESVPYKARIDASDVLLLNGTTLSQVVGTFFLEFSGAVIDFSTGTINKEDDSTPLGNNFTPQTIPSSEYFWYGVSLIPDTINADNTQNALVQVDLASATNASASAAPKPDITGQIKLGAIQIFNNGVTLEISDVRKLGVGSGSGGGAGSIKATFMDPLSTVLPTGTSFNVDGVAISDGDTVLFTNLLTGNNRVYEVDGVGVSLTWSAKRVFDNALDPEDGDSVRIQQGDGFADQLATFNGTNFLVNDVVRYFDGVGADYFEQSSIKTSTLVDNSTANLITVSYPGSENMIIDYSIIRGTLKETGQLFVTTNGTDATVTRQNTFIGDVGVEFSASISVGDLEIAYTTTSTGTNATMKYSVKRWSNSPGGPSGIPNYATSSGSSTPAAGNLGEIQFHGSGGTLDADSRLSWEASDGSLNLGNMKVLSLKGPITINDNQGSPLAVISYPVASYNFTILEYSIKRGSDYRVGRLLIPNSGAAVDISDDFVDTGSTGVTFSVIINSGNVEIRYVSTSTGQTGQLKYSLRQWSE